MTTGITDEATIKAILENSKTIAVVGWSDKEDRPSHEVAKYLVRHGYDVIGVNPRLAGKQGPGIDPVYGFCEEIPRPVDLVDVFRRPQFTPLAAEHAVAAGAKVLWLQLGISNDEAGAIAEAAGLQFAQNRCTKIDHMRLIRGIPLPTTW